MSCDVERGKLSGGQPRTVCVDEVTPSCERSKMRCGTSRLEDAESRLKVVLFAKGGDDCLLEVVMGLWEKGGSVNNHSAHLHDLYNTASHKIRIPLPTEPKDPCQILVVAL